MPLIEVPPILIGQQDLFYGVSWFYAAWGIFLGGTIIQIQSFRNTGNKILQAILSCSVGYQCMSGYLSSN